MSYDYNTQTQNINDNANGHIKPAWQNLILKFGNTGLDGYPNNLDITNETDGERITRGLVQDKLYVAGTQSAYWCPLIWNAMELGRDEGPRIINIPTECSNYGHEDSDWWQKYGGKEYVDYLRNIPNWIEYVWEILTTPPAPGMGNPGNNFEDSTLIAFNNYYINLLSPTPTGPYISKISIEDKKLNNLSVFEIKLNK